MRRLAVALGFSGLVLVAGVSLSGCVAVVAGVAAGAAAGTAASVKEGREEDASHSAMAYVGTVIANTVYFPVKVVFAGTGAVTSGLVYVVTLGDSRTTNTVWTTTTGGNYVVTPSMIEGRDFIHFTG